MSEDADLSPDANRSTPLVDPAKDDESADEPIWVQIAAIMADVPDELFDLLPPSDDLDAVIYGTRRD
jgi:hypothetical protein